MFIQAGMLPVACPAARSAARAPPDMQLTRLLGWMDRRTRTDGRTEGGRDGLAQSLAFASVQEFHVVKLKCQAGRARARARAGGGRRRERESGGLDWTGLWARRVKMSVALVPDGRASYSSLNERRSACLPACLPACPSGS